ncbi:MAG: response regulator, partial [Gammaproteobacteria bacterium]|nr:response regulator [Gammaproteobacteria bacterium]
IEARCQQNTGYDFIVTDMMMKNIAGGNDLLKQKLPVILLSPAGINENLTTEERARFHAVLNKPVRATELLRSIENIPFAEKAKGENVKATRQQASSN